MDVPPRRFALLTQFWRTLVVSHFPFFSYFHFQMILYYGVHLSTIGQRVLPVPSAQTGSRLVEMVRRTAAVRQSTSNLEHLKVPPPCPPGSRDSSIILPFTVLLPFFEAEFFFTPSGRGRGGIFGPCVFPDSPRFHIDTVSELDALFPAWGGAP